MPKHKSDFTPQQPLAPRVLEKTAFYFSIFCCIVHFNRVTSPRFFLHFHLKIFGLISGMIGLVLGRKIGVGEKGVPFFGGGKIETH